MDSSCSFHFTPNRLQFQQFAKLEREFVLLSDKKSCKITSIEIIKFHLHDGIERILEEVMYVLSLKQNLISLYHREKKGYVFKWERGMLKVFRGFMVVMKGVRKNKLYALEGVVICGLAFIAEKIIYSKKKLWHKQVGHVSKKMA